MAQGTDAKLGILLTINDLTPAALSKLDARLKKTGKTAETSFKKSGKAVDQLSSKVKGFAKQMVAFSAAGAVGLALRGGVKGFLEFSRVMTEVDTIAGVTAETMGELAEGVRQISLDLGIADDIVGKGLYQVLSAGITDTSDAMDVLRVASEASVAGLASVSQAVDLITTQINALGTGDRSVAEAARQFANMNQETVRLGKTTLPELAASLGQVLPLAAALGVSAEEINASLAALTLGGLNTAEAVTQIKSALSVLISPTEEALQLANQLGVSFKVDGAAGRGFVDVLNDLSEATGGNAEQLSILFPNIRALVGVLALAGEQGDALNSIMGELKGSTSALSGALGKQLKSDAKRAEIALNGLSQGWDDVGESSVKALIRMTGAIGDTEESAKRLKTVISAMSKVVDALALAITSLAFAASAIATAQAGIQLMLGRIDAEEFNKTKEVMLGFSDAAKEAAESLFNLEEGSRSSAKAQKEQQRVINERGDAMAELVRIQDELLAQIRGVVDLETISSTQLGEMVGKYKAIESAAKDLGTTLGNEVVAFFKDAVKLSDELKGSLKETAVVAADISRDLGEEEASGIEKVIALWQFGFETRIRLMEDSAAKEIALIHFRENEEATAVRAAFARGEITEALARGRLAVINQEVEAQIAIITSTDEWLDSVQGVGVAYAEISVNAESAGETADQAARRVFDAAVTGDSAWAGFAAQVNKSSAELLNAGRIGQRLGGDLVSLADRGIGGIADGLVEAGRVSGDFFKNMLKDIAKAIIRFGILRAISGATGGGGLSLAFAEGGIMPGPMQSHSSLPVRAYADGGIASTPQLAVFGEGRGAEAFVPLGGDRKIPVKFPDGGGGGGGQTVNVNLNVQSLDPSTAADVIVAQIPLIAQQIAAVIAGGEDRSLIDAVRGV